MAPTLSSVTATAVIATADTWNDIPASGFGTSYTDPIGLWDVPDGGEYIYTNQTDHEKIIPVDLAPGSVVSAIRAEIHGDTAADGLKFEFVSRSLNAASWTVVKTSTITSAVHVSSPATIASPTTIAADTEYAIRITSVVGGTGVKVFGVGYHTTKRVFK